MTVGGWEALRNQLKPNEDQQTKRDREKKLLCYKSIFSDPNGKVVLEDLRNFTVDRPTMPYNCPADGALAQMFMNIREGQNDMVRYIEEQIRRGNEL
jgi:hypothetical protein